MHRRLHMAMVCGRQHMAEIRSWQLLDGLLMPIAYDAGNCRWRVSDGELWTADMSGVLREIRLLPDHLLRTNNSADTLCHI